MDFSDLCCYTFFIKQVLEKTQEDFYLDLKVKSKSGTTWTITVTNKSPKTLTVAYNSKMCFESDAKEWANLKNIVKITLSSGESKNVTIKENWFATSIAFSWINSDVRMITWANGLNNSNKTLNEYHCSIEV